MPRVIAVRTAETLARREAPHIPLWVMMGHMIKESALRPNDLETSAGFRELGLMQLDERWLYDRHLARRGDIASVIRFLDPTLNVRAGAAMYTEYFGAVDLLFPGLDAESKWSLAYVRFSAGGGRADAWLHDLIGGGGTATYPQVIDAISSRARPPTKAGGRGNIAFITLLRLSGFRMAGAPWFGD